MDHDSNASVQLQQFLSAATRHTEVDPYVFWALATNQAHVDDDMLGQAWLHVMFEARSPWTAEKIARETYRDPLAHRSIRIAGVYRRPIAGLAKARFFTAAVKPAFLLHMLANMGGMIARFEICYSLRSGDDPDREEWPEPVWEAQYAPPAQPRGKKEGRVIVAAFDDDIAWAHERFLDFGRASRIAYVWDQSSALGAAPEALGYGGELQGKDIDRLRGQHTAAGRIDEDAIYRNKALPRLFRRWSHGTHVLDIAAGWGPADNAVHGGPYPIIAVQRARRRHSDTSGRAVPGLALDAIRYVLERADRLANAEKTGRCPVVFNMSTANIAGPHDGSSMFERAVDELIELRDDQPLAVVMASGNHQRAQTHARLKVAPADARSMEVRVNLDNAMPTFVELWLRKSGPQDIAIEVESPDGARSKPVSANSMDVVRSDGVAIGTVIFLERGGPTAKRKRAMALVAIAPTRAFAPDRAVSRHGLWKIRISNAGAKPVTVDAWVQRGDTRPGEPQRGRQSYFDDANFWPVDPATTRPADCSAPLNAKAYVECEDTMSAWATGQYTVAVGGFVRFDGKVAEYSASGSSQLPRPAALAVSDDGHALRGLLAAGPRSGAVLAADGTSVAAPQITRMIADMISAGAIGRGVTVHRTIRRIARRRDALGRFPTPKPSVARGEGRINLAPVVGAQDRRVRRDSK